jgi:transcriptional regulator with XRE-family HTH domain
MSINSELVGQRIGKLMKAARKSSGLTQMKVANAIGINQPVLSKVENLSLELGVVPWLRACEFFVIDPNIPLHEDLYEQEIKRLESKSGSSNGLMNKASPDGDRQASSGQS